MKLHELSTEIAQINDQLIESGGELEPYVEERLSSLNMDLAKKTENIGRWLLNIEAEEEALAKEIERLRVKKSQRGNLKERLKAYIKSCLEHAGLSKVETLVVSVRIQKNPPSLEIVDQDKIPAKYLIVKYDIDKKALLDALKNGEEIEGVKLVTDRTHLRIV